MGIDARIERALEHFGRQSDRQHQGHEQDDTRQHFAEQPATSRTRESPGKRRGPLLDLASDERGAQDDSGKNRSENEQQPDQPHVRAEL